MADNYETMNQESPNYGCFKEAVCIDASRVYDSCGDKDCLEDLRVYFSPASQAVIDQAAQVRMRNVDVLVVYLGLEPVPFHKGFYSVDMTFFFEVTLDVFQTPAAPPVTISGLSVFSKNVVLYGSEGNVCICRRYGGSFCMENTDKVVYATIGIFTIVQIERNVQMMIPAYDFCIPEKECITSSDNPCELFSRIDFPTNEFFPPKVTDVYGDDHGCGCHKHKEC